MGALIAFGIFYLVTDPTGAAGFASSAGHGLEHVAQLAVVVPQRTLRKDTVMVTVIVVVVAAWGAVWTAYATTAGSQRPSVNPFALAFYRAKGRYQWTATATLWAIAEGVAVLADGEAAWP